MKKIILFTTILVLVASSFAIGGTFPTTHPDDAETMEFIKEGVPFDFYIWEDSGSVYVEFDPSAKVFICGLFTIVQGQSQYSDIYFYKENGDILCGDIYVPHVAEIYISSADTGDEYAPAKNSLSLAKEFLIYYGASGNDDPLNVPALSKAVISNTCKVNINGLTVSGTKEVGLPITFTVNSKNSCAETIFYRFSYRRDYGTSGYDSAPWNQMTYDVYQRDNTCKFVFDEAGKYIVVVWAKNNVYSSNDDVMLIGTAVDISESDKEPFFPF